MRVESVPERHVANRASWSEAASFYTPSELDGTADLVHTGRGAICWVHDIASWARVVARLLKPGGVFHLFDSHPASYLFEAEAESLVPTGWDYFRQVDASRGWPSTYIGDSLTVPVEQQAEKYERAWPIGEVFGALREAGLVIEHLGEHREDFYESFPHLPPPVRDTLPARSRCWHGSHQGADGRHEQSMTCADIRRIRGVASDAVVDTLLAHGLVAEDPRFGAAGGRAYWGSPRPSCAISGSAGSPTRPSGPRAGQCAAGSLQALSRPARSYPRDTSMTRSSRRHTANRAHPCHWRHTEPVRQCTGAAICPEGA